MGKCNLTIEQLKNILYRIFEEEKRRENLEITLSDIYSFKYFNTAIFNKKLILIHSWHDLTTFINCLSITLRSIRTPAYYSYGKKNIVIVLDFYVLSPLIGKIINRCKFLINTKFSFALFTIYHELKHAMQEKSFQNHDYFTFDNIVFEMETNIIKWFRTHYSQNHDDYYMESDANVYGISRAEEYCRKHPNLVTEEDKALIRKRKKKYIADLVNYDFQSFFELFDKCQNIELIFRTGNIDYSNHWLDIFYDGRNRLKSLKEILSHPDLSKLDPKVLYLIITSKTYIKTIYFSELSFEQQMFLYNAFKYAFNIEKVKLYYHEKNQDIQAISKFNSRKQTILRNMDYYHRKIRELEKLMFCCDIDKNPNETNNLALK